MDHLLAADVLLGDQAALPTSSSGSVTYSHLANNVFYLAGRIVDNLWQGRSLCLSVCVCGCSVAIQLIGILS